MSEKVIAIPPVQVLNLAKSPVPAETGLVLHLNQWTNEFMHAKIIRLPQHADHYRGLLNATSEPTIP